MPRFDDRAQAKTHVKSFLSPVFSDPTHTDLIAEACLAEYEDVEWPSPPPGVFALMRPRQFWAIRDEDLKASDTLWKALAAAGSINFFQSSLTASAAVGLLSAVFGAFHAVRRYGIRLTIEQTRVLVAMKKLQGPCRPDEIAAALDVAIEMVNENLDSLQKTRRADGTVVGIVALDSDGRWACAGI